ncbi:hypothetical protein Q4498_01715 [Neptunomonas phycophila]|uniref:hypothetical protein n=1 Tax=Neptunomonas phycophila TaxID=1572645 RepID=UPI0026E3DE65|nr:hypothetical protein [Neptunomonas phycophila]MDO6466815.1 hypothetical protein [Neptunomonas phycophila]
MAALSYPAYGSIALSGNTFKFAPLTTGYGGTPVDPLVHTSQPAIDIKFPINMLTAPVFTFAGNNYLVRGGIVYKDWNANTQTGTAVGSWDEASKTATITTYANAQYFGLTAPPIFIDNFFDEPITVEEITFRTSLTNINPTSLQLRGTLYDVTTSVVDGVTVENIDHDSSLSFTAQANADTGAIEGSSSVSGFLDSGTGTVTIRATGTKFLDPSSIRYDAVSESRLPMDNELMGINPVRLPASGRVPVINRGGTLVIFHEQSQSITPTAGATVDCGRDDVALIEVLDANGFRLDYNQFTLDRAAGTITFEDPLILQTVQGDALTPPYELVDRIENMRVANDVDITGRVTVAIPPDRAFPAGSQVADAIVFGDTFARVYNEFHQETWNSGAPVWSDERIGDDTTAKYDFINSPIEISNLGSVTERWAIRSINSSTIQVIGEKFGVVLDNHSTSVDGDISPINPATGTPFFTMRTAGRGAGWVQNNVIRFNTEGAQGQQWLIRSVQPGAATEVKDSIEIETRGDAN